VERSGCPEMTPALVPMRLVDDEDGVVAVVDSETPVLTAEIVRDTLERTRR
jgi:hypothetical protein